MSIPQLHPEATEDPALIRWVTSRGDLPERLPQLAALIDEGVLVRAEVGSGEVRTWLAPGESWVEAGPTVRRALYDALSATADVHLGDDELRRRIGELLDREVAPVAESHGGGIRVSSVRDGVLTVEFEGACLGCADSGRTIGDLVTRAVRSRYPQIREVRAAKPRRVWLSLSRKRV